MNYKENIVQKPWGHEYLSYENEDVAIWILNIDKNHSTSMHCHPQKTTGLVVLDGIAEISFLADKRIVKSLDKLMIRRGLFHSTKALTDLVLLEIETPKDKHDLVRLKDNYGRTAKAYEDDKYETPKKDNCFWIEEPKTEKYLKNTFKNCTLKISKIDSLEDIMDYNDEDILIFLKGGMIRNIDSRKHNVTVPGDVGFGKIVKKVAAELDGVDEKTLLLSITKND